MNNIGYIVNGIIHRGNSYNGSIYKNYEAYDSKSSEPCYVAELCDALYTYDDFLSLAKDFYERNQQVRDNFKNYEWIADELFESVDWQSPSTLLDEWENDCAFVPQESQ